MPWASWPLVLITLTEILLNDAGQPSNWAEPTVTVQRIGLSSEVENKTNLLSLDKIDELDTLCGTGPGYSNLQSLISFDHPFSVNLYNITTKTVYEFKTSHSPKYRREANEKYIQSGVEVIVIDVKELPDDLFQRYLKLREYVVPD